MQWIHLAIKRPAFGQRQADKTAAFIGLKGKSGQVAIEATIAILAIFIFLLGASQVFIWMNQSIINRQAAYQKTRTSLGSAESIEFYQPKRLYIFPQEKND